MNQELDWDEVTKKLKDAFAKVERKSLKNLISEAMAKKKDEGHHCGSATYGYEIVSKKLIKVAKELEVIAFVKEAKANGDSLRTIADKLNAQRINTKRGGKWQASTINQIIKRDDEFM